MFVSRFSFLYVVESGMLYVFEILFVVMGFLSFLMMVWVFVLLSVLSIVVSLVDFIVDWLCVII